MAKYEIRKSVPVMDVVFSTDDYDEAADFWHAAENDPVEPDEVGQFVDTETLRVIDSYSS